MRILVLCKRRPQGRDLLWQPYGRFIHLNCGLLRHGHQVVMEMLSYDDARSVTREHAGLCLHVHPALPSLGMAYWRAVIKQARAFRPHWVIGCSDVWYGLLAAWLAPRLGARSLIDAYDNFETYHPRIPPWPQLWRRALHQATLVTAAGPQLAELMRASAGGRPVEVIPMAADPEFYPRDRVACRRALNLPPEARLIGYTGALERQRGLDTLFRVAAALQARDSRVRLVLSGRLGRGVKLPAEALWLGYRPPEEMPLLFNSLDLLLVVNRASAFGHYSYPAKLLEAMACQIPVVAARVAGTAWLLRDHLQLLAAPECPEDYLARAVTLLDVGRYDYGPQPSWDQAADQLNALLECSAGAVLSPP